ncbi:MAG: DUF6580 family putative transport protein [Patescibacteria group bacterium]
MDKNKLTNFFPYLLILIGASARLLPHAPNFTPIAALALFGAVYLRRRDSFWVPLVAMLLSDMLIGFYHPLIMVSVYGSFVLAGLIGIRLRRFRNVIPNQNLPRTEIRGRGSRNKKNQLQGWWPHVLGASLTSSMLFFLITNWAVWAWGGLYPKTITGLMMSYWMALPFFRNTLLGDVFYACLFFGIAECISLWVRRRNSRMEVAENMNLIIR